MTRFNQITIIIIYLRRVGGVHIYIFTINTQFNRKYDCYSWFEIPKTLLVVNSFLVALREDKLLL